jgi:peroxiredoxin
VSYARKYREFQQRGAEITAICVDTPEQNKAMIEKLLLPFHILSDPDGERAIKAYGLWYEQDRIAIPAIVVVANDRIIRYIYEGHDFADRPGDEELLAAVGETNLSGRSTRWQAVTRR